MSKNNYPHTINDRHPQYYNFYPEDISDDNILLSKKINNNYKKMIHTEMIKSLKNEAKIKKDLYQHINELYDIIGHLKKEVNALRNEIIEMKNIIY